MLPLEASSAILTSVAGPSVRDRVFGKTENLLRILFQDMTHRSYRDLISINMRYTSELTVQEESFTQIFFPRSGFSAYVLGARYEILFLLIRVPFESPEWRTSDTLTVPESTI
jgi:hypothetical protein